MIQPTYVTYPQAKWLKEKRFNEPTLMFYPDEKWKSTDLYNSLHTEGVDDASQIDNESWGNILYAPEQWLVTEWLRVNHKIHIIVEPHINENNNINGYTFCVFKTWQERVEHEINRLSSSEQPILYTTPQEAYSAAFDYIISNNLI